MAWGKESQACQQSIKGELSQSATHAFFHLPLTQILTAPAPLSSASTTNFVPSPSIMASTCTKGKWQASFVTDDDIVRLKQARYLLADVAHRAPEEGQIIPTPQPD